MWQVTVTLKIYIIHLGITVSKLGVLHSHFLVRVAFGAKPTTQLVLVVFHRVAGDHGIQDRYNMLYMPIVMSKVEEFFLGECDAFGNWWWRYESVG